MPNYYYFLRQKMHVTYQRVILLIVFAPAFICNSIKAKEYYMATDGNNANIGSFSQPWESIHPFAEVAEAGDILYIRGGTYITQEVILKSSGTLTKPITIRNYPNEVPILDGNREDSTAKSNAIVLDDGIFSGFDGPKHDWVFDGLI